LLSPRNSVAFHRFRTASGLNIIMRNFETNILNKKCNKTPCLLILFLSIFKDRTRLNGWKTEKEVRSSITFFLITKYSVPSHFSSFCKANSVEYFGTCHGPTFLFPGGPGKFLGTFMLLPFQHLWVISFPKKSLSKSREFLPFVQLYVS